MADEQTPPAAAPPDASAAFTGDGEGGTPSPPPAAPAPAPASDSFSEPSPSDVAAAAADGATPPTRDAQGRFVPGTPAKPVSRRQERTQQIQTDIDELVRARETTRQEIAALEARRAQLAAPPPPAAPRGPDPEPDLDAMLAAGKTYEDYFKTWTRWDRQQALDERFGQERARQAAQQQDARATETAAAHAARVEAFAAQHPDYAAVVSQADLPPISPAIDAVIRHEAVGPALAYYLAQHPETITAIARLGDTAPAYVALGRLTASLETTNGKPPTGAVSPATPLTKAHAPLTPVTGAGATATRAEDLPWGGEYVRRMNAEDDRTRKR